MDEDHFEQENFHEAYGYEDPTPDYELFEREQVARDMDAGEGLDCYADCDDCAPLVDAGEAPFAWLLLRFTRGA